MRTVSDIMTRQIVTLAHNYSLQLAKDILSLDRIRHFPVVEDGVIIGVVSQSDLYKTSLESVLKYGEKAQPTSLQEITVKEVMNEE